MYIPNPYFKNIPCIGDLVLDYIFIENGYPVLFTCYNKERIFLCLCRTLYDKQKWVISEININVLEKLIQNETSIYDALKNSGGTSCIASWKKGDIHEEYNVCKSFTLDDKDLPLSSTYLDDEGESLEYLEIVKNRLHNLNEQKTSVSALEKDTITLLNVSITYDAIHKFIENCATTSYFNGTVAIHTENQDATYHLPSYSIEKNKDKDSVNTETSSIVWAA